MIGALLRRSMPTLAAEKRELGHDGFLHLLEARRGRGKSYNMTAWVRRAVSMKVPVRANFVVNVYRLGVQSYMDGTFGSLDESMAWCRENVRVCETWDDLFTAYDEIILLDEASRIFDSRNRAAPPVAFEWFQQSRKLKLTIVLASQSFDWLDVRIRQLADVLWMVRKELVKGSTRPKQFWMYGLDPWSKGLTESVLRDRADFLSRVPFVLDTATLYNSWELIRLIEGTPSWESMGELAAYHVEVGNITDRAALLGSSPSAGERSALRASTAADGLPVLDEPVRLIFDEFQRARDSLELLDRQFS